VVECHASTADQGTFLVGFHTTSLNTFNHIGHLCATSWPGGTYGDQPVITA
jgi:hypothetical protein